MSAASDRARSTWLLSFADVVTLLITFFIMMLALHHTEISQVQKWTQDRIHQSYIEIQDKFFQQPYEYISVMRDGRGVLLSVSHPQAFERGGYEVSQGLRQELIRLAQDIDDLTLFRMHLLPEYAPVIERAQADGLDWRVEVKIQGHTDNDPIAPGSRLRNNWFLSTMRAQNVMQLLFEHSSLPNHVFLVAGFGEHRPVADNDTEEGKAQNRRVDIHISASFIRQNGFEF